MGAAYHAVKTTKENRSMSESRTLQLIRLAVSRTNARLFRNNVAKGWIGEHKLFRRAKTVEVKPGDVLIRRARRLHSGLCVGSSDLIGWTPTEITADMVGRTLAVFTAIEVKSATGSATKEQENFIERVRAVGGVAGVARSEGDALDLIGR